MSIHVVVMGVAGCGKSTAQGQQQRMTAAWENAQAALGQALLPALTVGAQKLAEFTAGAEFFTGE